MVPLLKTHPLLRLVNNSLVDLPAPSCLRVWFNFGSLLGVCLVIQIIRGLFLAIHYSCDTQLAFESVGHISRDVNFGWALRIIHANGARFFFINLYVHIGRGLYHKSYNYHTTWAVGVTLFLLVMARAFLGYVLPWGQISFWGATVITNLFSALPYVGGDIVYWLWGGFSVDNATLTRFFALHFLLPFLVAALRGVHLLFLHQTGSSHPLGLNPNYDKVPFHPYYSVKDLLYIVVILLILSYIVTQDPWLLGDPENFIPANPLVTPLHIQPEWYFLFAYAILRSIPNKLGGVVALFMAVLILYILPLYSGSKFRTCAFEPIIQILFWGFVGVVLRLTWIGARPVEDPYIITGQVLTAVYFSYFLLIPWIELVTPLIIG